MDLLGFVFISSDVWKLESRNFFLIDYCYLLFSNVEVSLFFFLLARNKIFVNLESFDLDVYFKISFLSVYLYYIWTVNTRNSYS